MTRQPLALCSYLALALLGIVPLVVRKFIQWRSRPRE